MHAPAADDHGIACLFFVLFFCEAGRCRLISGVRTVLNGSAAQVSCYNRLGLPLFRLLECILEP